jgi:hypothetical protein
MSTPKMTPLTPTDVWDEVFGLDRHPWDRSPLNYDDGIQRARIVTLNGEQWAVMVRRVSPREQR